jgi:hypothetical protein
MFGVRLHNEDLIPGSILFKEYDRVVYVYYWDKVKMEIIQPENVEFIESVTRIRKD